MNDDAFLSRVVFALAAIFLFQSFMDGGLREAL